MGISLKDAKTFVTLDGGERLDYLFDVISFLRQENNAHCAKDPLLGKTAANWQVFKYYDVPS